MEIISLAKGNRDGDPILSIAVEDDRGDIRTIAVPESSSRYDRTLKLATTAMTTDDEDAREKAFDGIAAMHDISRRVESALKLIESDTRGTFTMSRAGVLYDGHLLPSLISDHIIRILDDKEPTGNINKWSSFSKFIDKLFSNVDDYVRDQLFGWIQSVSEVSGGFTLTTDGNILAYKGLASASGVPVSGHSGNAFVKSLDDDGNPVVTEYKMERIPNRTGTEVFMERSQVDTDPASPCSFGLHVSNIEYARSYASGFLVLVEVDPRDFVSVPLDANFQKARVARYKVLREIATAVESTYYDTSESENDEDESDEYGDDRYEDDEDEYGWR